VLAFPTIHHSAIKHCVPGQYLGDYVHLTDEGKQPVPRESDSWARIHKASQGRQLGISAEHREILLLLLWVKIEAMQEASLVVRYLGHLVSCPNHLRVTSRCLDYRKR
jgi:hypothetical protein